MVVDDPGHESGCVLLEMSFELGVDSCGLEHETVELSSGIVAKSIRPVCEILDVGIIEIVEDGKTLRCRSWSERGRSDDSWGEFETRLTVLRSERASCVANILTAASRSLKFPSDIGFLSEFMTLALYPLMSLSKLTIKLAFVDEP